jgi:hypothetical protein
MFVVFYKFYILIIEDNTRLIGCLVSRKNNTPKVNIFESKIMYMSWCEREPKGLNMIAKIGKGNLSGGRRTLDLISTRTND